MDNLRAEGHEVYTATDGQLALDWLAAEQCGLIVLDVMLPRVDGFTVCRTLRQRGDSTPVLFLTARGDPADRVTGLEAGGDDYMAKPFHLQEFLLRVRAILRRWDWYRNASATPASAVLQFAGNEVDFRAFRARSWNGIAQELTEKEAMILKVLAEHPGEIVSREDLLEKVWGYDVFPSTRTVDNFILRLRKRFERDPANPKHFLTVWGVGYRFMIEGEVMSEQPDSQDRHARLGARVVAGPPCRGADQVTAGAPAVELVRIRPKAMFARMCRCGRSVAAPSSRRRSTRPCWAMRSISPSTVSRTCRRVLDPGIELAAALEREDPRDAVLSRVRGAVDGLATRRPCWHEQPAPAGVHCALAAGY